MSWRRIAVVYGRDLRDAIHDGRILVAVLLPVALAVYYSVAIPDATERVPATLEVVGDRGSQLVGDVRDAVAELVDLTVRGASTPRRAEQRVRDDAERVALVLPDDLDRDVAAAARAGRTSPPANAAPQVRLILSDAPTAGASLVATAVSAASSRLDDRTPPVRLSTHEVRADEGAAFERLGTDGALVVFAVVMLTGFIGMLAVPVLLMEEVSLGTLEALRLVASSAEIVLAKLLVGLTYCAIAIGITIPAAQLSPALPFAFAAWALLLSIALSGFGLAFGLVLGDPGRVNTWSGVVLLPLLVPVFAVLGEPQPWTRVMSLLPTGAGTELLAHAIDPSALEVGAGQVVVLVAWAAGGFILLWQLLERRSG